MSERARTERETDYTSVLESILDAATDYSIVASQLDGTLVLWNEGARRVYGYEPPEIMGKNIRDLYPPEDVALGKVDEVLSTALEKGRWAGTAWRIRKAGDIFPARIALTVRRDRRGRPIGFLSISRDVSEEIGLDRLLKESEAYNRGLIESAVDGLLTTDLNGRILDANKEMERLTGQPRAQLIDRPLQELIATPSALDGVFQRVVREGKVRDVELKLYRLNGETTDVAFNATTLGQTREGRRGIIATIRDIAESKRLRDQLEQRNRELEIQNFRVQQANLAKSEFLARVSHELRTPLNSIIGFSDFMLTSGDNHLTADQREYLTDILNSGNHLLSLINDILDLAKVESGKLNLAPVNFAVTGAVEEVCSSLRPQLLEHGVVLRTQIAPGIDRVDLDEVRFKQILYNLLSNAVKFTPKGGRAEVTVEPKGESHLVVSVRDTGIGIAEKDLERIFLEFEQLDSGVARKYSGTGLGLPVTQRIVERMGGSITVQSQVGVGSTFTVQLPLVPSKVSPGEGAREGVHV
jgi:PAS domain S-box-containing protein